MVGASLQGGSLSDVGQPSRYGAVLRFRLNNTGNYSRIELIRLQFNVGQGINTIPDAYVAHVIDTPFGISPWVQFTDIGTKLEGPIADAEVAAQSLFILKAKAVRYIDNRFVLGNIEVAPKDVSLTFRNVGGALMFSVTGALGKAGHHDPVNQCYKKNFLRGERYRFGIQLFDALGGKAFVVPLPDEFQFPNRRDEKTGDSLRYSDAPCYAVNNNQVVTPTFEAFDMENSVTKTNSSDVFNIMIHAVNVGGPEYFAPVTPTQPTDANRHGLNYNVNSNVRQAPVTSSGTLSYNPKVFEPNFHAMAAALYGITDIPEWVSGFSIVRSEPANRVICQGLASYRVVSGTESTAPSRRTSRVLASFPDIASGIVPENVVNDFDANPGNY